MNNVENCPDSDELERWLMGAIPEARVLQIETHLPDCLTCQGEVQRLRTGLGRDTVHISGEAVDVTPPPIPHDSPVLLPPAETLNFKFLGPPVAAGELGRLAGYRIESVLGVGGMGLVFRAREESLDRFVALKVMKPLLAAHQVAVKRFLLEARATAAINSDHVVKIFQVGEDREIPFIAMEFLVGGSLEKVLKDRGKLTIAESLCIADQIAAGLEAAHNSKLIHRDISPSNVMLVALSSKSKTAEGEQSATQSMIRDELNNSNVRVKLVDFGLVRAMDEDSSLSRTGMVAGTPLYMSPEQAEGREVDFRTDFFSLGCILYRMLSGEVPFPQKGTTALLLAITSRPHPPVRSNDPQIPREVAAIVDRLMEKDPNNRFQTAAEIRQALQQVRELLTRRKSAEQTQSDAKLFSLRKRYAWTTFSLAAVAAMVVWAFFLPHREGEPGLKPSDQTQTPALATSSTPDQPEPPPTQTPGKKGDRSIPGGAITDRAFAEQIIGAGGRVRLNNSSEVIENLTNLPVEPFTIVEVVFPPDGPPFNEQDAATLGQLTRLESLTLGTATILPTAWKGLLSLPGLRRLRFEKLYLEQHQLRMIAEQSHLDEISFAHQTQPQGNLEELSLSNTLKQVHFEGPANVLSVENLQRLRPELKIDGVNLSPIPQDESQDAKVARYVLAMSGLLFVRQGDQIFQISSPDKLPADPYEISGIELAGNLLTNDRFLEMLHDLKGLERLDLNNTRITDQGLKSLHDLPKLSTLFLHSNAIGDPSMETIGKITSLEWIHLESTGITDGGVLSLIHLKKLHFLSLSWTRVTSAVIPLISAHFLDLDNLTLSHLKMDAETGVLLEKLTSLQTLTLAESDLSTSGLGFLANIPRLSRLSVSGSKLPENLLPELQKLKRLTKIFAFDTSVAQIPRSVLREQLPGVEVVCDRARAAAEFCFGNGRNAVLTLSMAGKGNLEVRKASDLPDETFEVQKINFSGCHGLNTGIFWHLRDLKGVQSIDLSDSDVAPAEIGGLLQYPRLSEINLTGTAVNDRAISPLLSLKTLRSLNLSRTAVSAAEVKRLRQALPDCQVIGP